MTQKLILVWILPLIGLIKAGLTLNKECQDIVCGAHFYCSPTDHLCRPCEVVCDISHNNHDQNRCESDCQDYLHDIRYLKSTEAMEKQIESELWTLKLLLGVTIGMTTTLMILTVIILLKLQLKKTKKQRKQVMELPAVIYTNKYEKSSLPSTVSQGPENNNPSRFRREPSESTLPEYSSYDNPALAPSPTHHV